MAAESDSSWEGYKLNTAYTADVVHRAIGTRALRHLCARNLFVASHMLGVGQIAAEVLYESGCSAETVELGALVGGLHDIGANRADLMPMATRARPKTPAQRQRYNDAHAEEGGRILRIAAERFSDLRLQTAGFVAAHHHDAIPTDYPTRDGDEARLWGLAHIVQLADMIHTGYFDPSTLGPDGNPIEPPELYRQAVDAYATPPVLDGVEVDLRHGFAYRLGIPAAPE